MLSKLRKLLPEFEVRRITMNLYYIKKDNLSVPFFVTKDIQEDARKVSESFYRFKKERHHS